MSSKRILCVFAVFLIMFALFFQAAAKTTMIDPKNMNNGIWDSAQTYVLKGSFGDGCSVRTAFIQYYIQDENTVYLRLCATENSSSTTAQKSDENSAAIEAVTLTVENETALFTDEKEETIQFDDITLTGAVYSNENQINCVVRINFKKGVPDTFDCSVIFSDSNAVSSNEKSFTCVTGVTQTTAQVLTETQKETKVKTTSEKTTKATTAKVTTVKTTKEKKTKAPSTTKHRAHLTAKTTSLPSTKAATTRQVTTSKKAVKTTEKITSLPGTTAFDKEKEVIISLVTLSQTTAQNNDTITISKNGLLKTAVAICGVVLFAALGIFAVRSGKSEENDENDDD